MPNTKLDTSVNKEFESCLLAFTRFLSDQQHKEVKSILGRKFVKIVIDNSVRYFVEKKTGVIYGSKSRFAPNFHHYFGTIYNADKWDWSGYYGVSISDDTVRAVKNYGPYTHYIPI
jgi:hypothetical protein